MLRRSLGYILAYGLWFVSGAISLWAMIRLRQFLLIDLPIMVLMPVGLSQYGQRAMDRFGTVILGLLWLIFVVASESYFRKLAEGEIGIKQVAKIFAAEALIIVLALGGTLLVG